MTYCLAIAKDIDGPCPLQPGKCFYQHRQTGECVAYKLTDAESVNTLAKAVGLPEPDAKEVRRLQKEIQHTTAINLRGEE